MRRSKRRWWVDKSLMTLNVSKHQYLHTHTHTAPIHMDTLTHTHTCRATTFCHLAEQRCENRILVIFNAKAIWKVCLPKVVMIETCSGTAKATWRIGWVHWILSQCAGWLIRQPPSAKHIFEAVCDTRDTVDWNNCGWACYVCVLSFLHPFLSLSLSTVGIRC